MSRGLLTLPLLCLLVHSALASPQAGDRFGQRLEQVSRELLGRPYRFSPLGEGRPPDSDPLMRLDTFDCTTYIETVMALSMADTAQHQQALLTRIRYRDGKVDYANRRHLPASQWLPGLEAMGLLHDITAAQGGAETLHLRISPSLWAARHWRLLPDLPSEAVPDADIALPYLPLAGIEEKLRKLQRVTLISVVHRPQRETPLAISHQALLIPGPDGPSVRHARSGNAQAVVEESLKRFLQRLRRERFWPVIGLNLAEIHPPGGVQQ